MPRDVLTQTELLGENGIAFGPLDHVQKAELREARAVVFSDGVHDLLIAAGYEHVRYRLINRFPFRNREQMRLAFGADVGDQGVSLQSAGLLEHRAGNLDRIVKGELVEDIDRGTVEGGEPPCKLCAGGNFDLIREPSDHVAEGPNLVVAISAGYH